jgi:large subunit ribosomal protein L24
MIARIKKNDTIVVIAGKDKGRQGTVVEIAPKADKVMVKGLALVTRHAKARRQGDVAGIKKQEGYIALSHVMPLCSACKKPCRITTKLVENNTKVRACNRCQETV